MAETVRTESDLDAVRFGYLMCPVNSSGAYLGGLLITNGWTHPKHFAYVDPVSPTPVQKMLYSITLDSAARVSTVAKALIGTLDREPDVLFVDDERLLEVDNFTSCPVAWLRKSNDSQEAFSTIAYTVSRGLDQSRVSSLVTPIEQKIDLVEPFDRIKRVLVEVSK